MSKAKIVDKKSEKSVRYERELLSRIKHPYFKKTIQNNYQLKFHS